MMSCRSTMYTVMSRKFEIGKSEYLLYNIICDDISAFFRPLNIIQSFFFMPIYTIRDNFITYPSFFSISISLIFVIFSMTMFSIRTALKAYADIFAYFTGVFDSVYYSFGYSLLFCMCIVYKDCNIDLVLKIQDLRSAGVVTNNNLGKFTKVNWSYVFCFTVYYLTAAGASVILLYMDLKTVVFFEIICFVLLLVFDVNIVYIIQITRLLTTATKQWVLDSKYYSDLRNIVTNLKEIETENGVWRRSKENAFINILDAFQNTNNAFQLLILYHCAETFIHAFFYVYRILSILTNTNESRGWATAALLISWVLKNFLYEAVLCLVLEYYYLSVNDATITSLLQITNRECSVQEKRMHKNVVRMSRLSCKFEVCNLFSLDGTMPRSLLALIATYTIVLLQFVLI